MHIGYARVSTDDQSTDAQLRALTAAGCGRVFTETASGSRWKRPELERLLDQLRPGDVIVVWKLDRLTRSLADLLRIMETIQKAGAGFQSLTEAIDTTTPAGRMMMQMLGSFAEFERNIILERTRAGIDQARQKGKRFGRPPALSATQQAAAVTMIQNGTETAAGAARIFGVSDTTISRLLRRRATVPVQ